MAVELTIGDTTTLTLIAEDAAGKQLPDPGARTWTSTDATIVSVSAPDANGVVTVAAVAAGTATVSVSDVEPNNPDGSAGATFAGSQDFIVSAPADPITQVVLEVGPITHP